MMKRALLLLSLLAVPCVLTSYMAEAAPSTDTATTTLSPLDKLCQYWSGSDKVINILRAGYKSDTATLESLKDKKHIGIYCTGAAAAGNKELVLQCLDKGATDYNDGLQVAALGGHMDIVQLMLNKGAHPDYGLSGAAMGGHMDIVQLMLSKGAINYNWGLFGAAGGGHMDIVQLLLSKGAADLGSALYAAEFNGHTKCAELIRAAMKK